MKIVTNNKGLYAIRKGIWPFYKFFDLKTPGFWRKRNQIYYIQCFDQKDKVEAWFGILNPKIATIIVQENNKKLGK